MDGERTELSNFVSATAAPAPSPHVLHIAGPMLGKAQKLGDGETLIGRAKSCHLRIDELGVSRTHARIAMGVDGTFTIEDLGSANGTLLNGRRITTTQTLTEGDKIQLGTQTVLRFSLCDTVEQEIHEVNGAGMSDSQILSVTRQMPALDAWTPESWRKRKAAQAVTYDDPAHLEQVFTTLRRMPPLVTSWEIEDLKSQIAEAQEGRRFLLQGGDCAERLLDCDPTIITNKLKILIQMSLVLIRGARRPVIRVGRFAGQYAKPRSKMTEVRDGVELPSYLGDLVNQPEFSPSARKPNPELLLDCYQHAAMTLNFIRGLSAGGFADLRRPEFFDLSYFARADLPPSLRLDYNRMAKELTESLEFLRAVGDSMLDDLMRVNFFTSHEGLNLVYESAQTRRVPWQEGVYNLSTHMPWIGERTRSLDGAHVEYFRGIANPIGVKVGPTADPLEIVDLARALNPTNEPGKLVLITRLGAKNVNEALPKLIAGIGRARRRVLWVSDPMHGNGMVAPGGVKTRNFDDILAELESTAEVHRTCGTVFGGVHFELTGEDVTECTGGGIEEADLSRNYATVCDPRLNYRQAIQMAFCLADRLKSAPRPPTIPPAPPSARRVR
jgi:3-deoxy-7-phosphoheptulonate synthase